MKELKTPKQGEPASAEYVESVFSRMIFCLASFAVIVMMAPGLSHSVEVTLRPFTGLPSVEEAVEDALPSIANDEHWFSLSEDEKVSLLQTVVDYEAKRLQIPPPKLKAESLMSTTSWLIGKYYPFLNQISYDKTLLECRLDWEETINTVCHETYHGYQFFVSLGLLEDRDGMRDTWLYEGIHYIPSSKDREAYRNQSLEVSAREYAYSREAEYAKEVARLAA